jgi:hypothetical protein
MATSALRRTSAAVVSPCSPSAMPAGADPQRCGRELERLLERELDALGDAGGALVVAAVEQHGELVAAQPGRQVAGAQAGAQATRERDQQLVADLVAEAVVNALEVVEVEEQHDGAAVGPGDRGLHLPGRTARGWRVR